MWPDVRNSGAFRRFVVEALFGGFLDKIRGQGENPVYYA